jgi:hypothetical protein
MYLRGQEGGGRVRFGIVVASVDGIDGVDGVNDVDFDGTVGVCAVDSVTYRS